MTLSKFKREVTSVVAAATGLICVPSLATNWYDFHYHSNGTDYTLPWGLYAIGAVAPNSANIGLGLTGFFQWHTGSFIYVIDSGVASHKAYFRTLADGKAGLECIEHATAVAGVIGADLRNILAPERTIKGVFSGQNIRSVLREGKRDPDVTLASSCDAYVSKQLPEQRIQDTIDSINSTRTKIAAESAASGYYTKPSIVNFSSNWTISDTNLRKKVHDAIRSLATPVGERGQDGYYPGALVLQSAGNFYQDACNHAYYDERNSQGNRAASLADGIMVVGGIDQNGLPVRPMNQTFGYRNSYLNFDNPEVGEPGSNYGYCIDIWAPSKEILTTVPNRRLNGSEWIFDTNVPDNKTAYVSGTSFSAPHVAGIAAAILASDFTDQFDTPAKLESEVRSRAAWSTVSDQAGIPVYIAQYPKISSPPPIYPSPQVEIFIQQGSSEPGLIKGLVNPNENSVEKRNNKAVASLNETLVVSFETSHAAWLNQQYQKSCEFQASFTLPGTNGPAQSFGPLVVAPSNNVPSPIPHFGTAANTGLLINAATKSITFQRKGKYLFSMRCLSDQYRFTKSIAEIEVR
jgi:hypothetical protein